MRKVDPTDVLDDFVSAIDDLEVVYRDVIGSGPKDQTVLTTAELVVMSAAVLWEGVVSDLFAGYINRDSSRFRAHLEGRVRDSVKNKFGADASAYLILSFPKHLKKQQVYGLLDPRDYNLTFDSPADLIMRAGEILPAAAANKFKGLTDADKASISAWKEIRDFAAHRSEAAMTRLNDALKDKALIPALRRGKHRVQAVGAFLKTIYVGKGKARVVCYLDEMRAIARKL